MNEGGVVKKILCNSGTESLAKCGNKLVEMKLLSDDQMKKWTALDEKYHDDVMELLGIS